MKRSKAVKILQNIVLEHMNCVCCHDDETMYFTMLKKDRRKDWYGSSKSLGKLYVVCK